jgi:hypothetical protein
MVRRHGGLKSASDRNGKRLFERETAQDESGSAKDLHSRVRLVQQSRYWANSRQDRQLKCIDSQRSSEPLATRLGHESVIETFGDRIGTTTA